MDDGVGLPRPLLHLLVHDTALLISVEDCDRRRLIDCFGPLPYVNTYTILIRASVAYIKYNIKTKGYIGGSGLKQ